MKFILVYLILSQSGLATGWWEDGFQTFEECRSRAHVIHYQHRQSGWYTIKEAYACIPK